MYQVVRNKLSLIINIDQIIMLPLQFITIIMLVFQYHLPMTFSHKIYRHLQASEDDNNNVDGDKQPPSSQDNTITNSIPTMAPTKNVPTALLTGPPASIILPPNLESSASSSLTGDANNEVTTTPSSTFYMYVGGIFVILVILMLIWRRLRSSKSSSSVSSSSTSQYSRLPQTEGDIEFGLKSSSHPVVVHADDDEDEDENEEEGEWEEWNETKNSKNMTGSFPKKSSPSTNNNHVQSSKSSVSSASDLRASSQSTPTKMSPITSEVSLKSHSFDGPSAPPHHPSSAPSSTNKPKKAVPSPSVPADVDLFAVSCFILLILFV